MATGKKKKYPNMTTPVRCMECDWTGPLEHAIHPENDLCLCPECIAPVVIVEQGKICPTCGGCVNE